ncbi:TPA: hypothetical protein UMI80_003539 [Clostridioides difficile]|nr:hypothetical protein [Clostridioides difficile]HEL3290018.1 hypothetical protein [Clostridioides difficile]HEL4679715.1 hypothetical protein [Clostridioides difficile]
MINMDKFRIINEKCPVINEFVSLACEYSAPPGTFGSKLMSTRCDGSHICDSSSNEECPILKKLLR